MSLEDYLQLKDNDTLEDGWWPRNWSHHKDAFVVETELILMLFIRQNPLFRSVHRLDDC